MQSSTMHPRSLTERVPLPAIVGPGPLVGWAFRRIDPPKYFDLSPDKTRWVEVDLSKIERQALIAQTHPRRVLVGLEVVFEGGPRNGQTRDLRDRDVREIKVSMHRNPRRMGTSRYVRTITIDQGSGRTVFRFAGTEVRTFERPVGIWPTLRRVLVCCGLLQPRVLVDL